MSVFCLLWLPLVLLFWFSLNPGRQAGSGAVWAVLLGSLIGILHFLSGAFVRAEGFGLSRWFFALADIVFVPAVLPVIVFFCFSFFRLFKNQGDLCAFVLLWLIPEGILRTIGWSVQNDPLYLVLVPLIWTSLALGMSFLVDLACNSFGLWVILPILAAVALPFAAATCFWHLYGNFWLRGAALLLLTLAPAAISVISLLIHRGRE